MKYEANSVEEYIAQLPEERQEVVEKLRKIISESLPNGFEEGINYNMIGFYVPHSVFPKGYHCNTTLPLPFINIASQKNFIALYHSGIYADESLLDWFKEEYPKHATYKLDMGKSCVRFKKMHDIPYDLIAELCQKITVEQWIDTYEATIKKK